MENVSTIIQDLIFQFTGVKVKQKSVKVKNKKNIKIFSGISSIGISATGLTFIGLGLNSLQKYRDYKSDYDTALAGSDFDTLAELVTSEENKRKTFFISGIVGSSAGALLGFLTIMANKKNQNSKLSMIIPMINPTAISLSFISKF